MMNYNKNKLINETLDQYYETFSHMLDTCDYVPKNYNDKIGNYIFKNMKKSFGKIDKEDRKFQRKFKKDLKFQTRAEKQKNKELKTNIRQKKLEEKYLKIKELKQNINQEKPDIKLESKQKSQRTKRR